MALGRLRRRQDGAAAVEFALVVPLFLTLMFGIFEFGRLFAWHTAIVTASREAARYGSAIGDSANGFPQYTNCDEIIAAGKALSVVLELEDADFTVGFDSGPGTTVRPCSDPTTNLATINDGDRIVVTVSREFESVVPLIGDIIGPLTLEGTDRRSIALDVIPVAP